MSYDNSEVDINKKNKSIELDLEAAKKEKYLEEVSTTDKGPDLDNEVDKIDTNMAGKEGQVDHIETMMISKNKKSEAKTETEKKSKDLNLQDPEVPTDEMAFYDKENPFGLGFSEEDDLKKDQDTTPEQEIALERRGLGFELESGAKKDKSEQNAQDEIRKDNLASLLDDSANGKKRNEANVKLDENELNMRPLNKSDLKEGKERDLSHDGQVEKIDTFYRNSDSKKTEHDWDNLHKKNDSMTLDLIPKNRSADNTMARALKTQGEEVIDYRKLKEEFDLIDRGANTKDMHAGKTPNSADKKNYDEGSFKVIELDIKSLDFSITVVNAIYENDTKAKKIFAMIADELVSRYQCYPVFYTYKLHEKKFNEAFNSFAEIKDEQKISVSRKEWWDEYKKQTALFEHFQTKSMTTWKCSEVIIDGAPWEDVELPTWADQELRSRHVELIFPYFDGIDRMGMAVILFPEGINLHTANSVLTVLEMARTLFLDTIERYQVRPLSILVDPVEAIPQAEDKKGVLNFFGGLFGKRKAG
jgi:predicted DNA-binding antitoxin AbrB/MazE fold protein